jgi:hypothetical protein
MVFVTFIEALLSLAFMNIKKTIPEVDQNIISHFICTHRLDSTIVDLDPYLLEKDLIFHPVKKASAVRTTDGPGARRYADRMKSLFTLYREKN